jgi:hypothetical protein
MRFRILAALVLLAAASVAQTFRGAIQGTVLDSTGAAIPAAQVTVTSVDTNLVRQVLTDDAGNYAATELPLGSYRVTASKPGFRTETAGGIQVTVAASQRVDLTLTPGEMKETIEVTAAVPLVDASGDAQGGTIDSQQISDLPVNGRDFGKAVLLVPGATSDPASVSDSPGAFGTFSINGNRGRSNN